MPTKSSGPAVGSGASCFYVRLARRLVTTDRASSNLLCETSYLKSPKLQGWLGIHHPCDIHVVAGIFSRVFGLCDDDITGMVRHSLSLSASSDMNCFRRALRAEVRARGVRILRGASPISATRHRNYMLRVFARRGHNILSTRLLCALLPNGDWRAHEIQLYISDNSQLDPEHALQIVCNGLITALAGTMFEIYPRHRWTGSDIALDRVGLLESVHNLGSSTYSRFLRMFHGGAVPTLPVVERAAPVAAILGDIAGPAPAGGQPDPEAV